MSAGKLITPPWNGWKIVKEIGRGNYGTVYEIEKNIEGFVDKAAMKVISIPQRADDIADMYSEGYDDESITSTFKEHLDRMLSEYQLMRHMSGCSNIVNCDEVTVIKHTDHVGWDIFIKMELLTPLRDSLSDVIAEETVIKVAKHLCNALVLCKEYNIVHRDIKPQNIFISPNKDYKLGDFGVAKTIERTMGGTVAGTYKYMAPEVYKHENYGSAADIYSLGLTLYWMLNERRMPFMPLPPAKLLVGADELARERRLRGEPFPEPKNGSDDLKAIVMKACSYRPEDRYPSAAAMLADLETLKDLGTLRLPWLEPDAVDSSSETINELLYDNLCNQAGEDAGAAVCENVCEEEPAPQEKIVSEDQKPEKKPAAGIFINKKILIIAAGVLLALIILLLVLVGRDKTPDPPALETPELSDEEPQVVVPEITFADVDETAWYYECVTELAKAGLLTGFEEIVGEETVYMFRPVNPDPTKPENDHLYQATYAQALKLIMLGIGYEEQAATSDLHWASGYLDTAIADNLISSSVTVENLDEPITRYRISQLAACALKLPHSPRTESPFFDLPMDHAYTPYILSLHDAGIINGDENGNFMGDSHITRAEMAAIVWRMLNYEG